MKFDIWSFESLICDIDGSTEVVSEPIQFYDSGGPSYRYSNNENYFIIFDVQRQQVLSQLLQHHGHHFS